MSNKKQQLELIELEAKEQGVWNLILEQAEFLMELDPDLSHDDAVIQASVHIIE